MRQITRDLRQMKRLLGPVLASMNHVKPNEVRGLKQRRVSRTEKLG